MRSLAWAVGLTLAGSLGGVLVASGLLFFNDRLRVQLVPWLVSYAVGTLLGVALLVLLPEALEVLSPRAVLGSLLAGIMLFFLLEKLVLWRHCHTHDCEAHGMAAPMVVIGDAFHNFLDGVVIGTAVRTSIPLGVSTALAVATHEIPQELGDMAILLHAGYSRKRALALNLLSGASSVVGAVVAVLALDWLPRINEYVLSVAAASFLYVAMADLIPDLHRGRIDATTLRQLALALAGIGTVVGLNTFVGGH
ncbi:MAG TPA: ZIP family metal transporter [Vicinamibacterales bacterium]|nr:ZIP family metal transporter [Vicinamibacterales bacterium]